MSPELEHRLSALADKLGVSVEHLWGVLVRQASMSEELLVLFLIDFGRVIEKDIDLGAPVPAEHIASAAFVVSMTRSPIDQSSLPLVHSASNSLPSSICST
jgi:hypothetical protein